jgi:hypothetical protein
MRAKLFWNFNNVNLKVMRKYVFVSVLMVLAFSGCKPKCVKCTSWHKDYPEQTKTWAEVCQGKKENDEFVKNMNSNKQPGFVVVCE